MYIEKPLYSPESPTERGCEKKNENMDSADIKGDWIAGAGVTFGLGTI